MLNQKIAIAMTNPVIKEIQSKLKQLNLHTKYFIILC